MSGIITDYLAVGLYSMRPAVPTPAPGGLSFHYATDESILSLWDPVAPIWQEVYFGGVTIPSGGTAGEGLLKVSGTDFDYAWGTVLRPTDIGTGAGQVAAGNDARIVNSLPTTNYLGSPSYQLTLGNSSFVQLRIPGSTSTATSFNTFRTAGGTLTSPTTTPTAYHVYAQRSEFWDGSAYILSSRWRQVLKPATPSSTDAGSIQIFETCAAGSATIAELYRWDYDVGLSLYGSANVVIDNNRIFRNRSYIISGLPAAASYAGSLVYDSDLGGGGGLVQSNGTSWRRISDSSYAGISVDANATFTYTYLTNAVGQVLTVPITATRTVTLTAGAPAGVVAEFTREVASTGAFNWAIGSLKNLAAGTWCKIRSDGTNWRLVQYGAL